MNMESLKIFGVDLSSLKYTVYSDTDTQEVESLINKALNDELRRILQDIDHEEYISELSFRVKVDKKDCNIQLFYKNIRIINSRSFDIKQIIYDLSNHIYEYDESMDWYRIKSPLCRYIADFSIKIEEE